ncbi:MAG: type IX secretion system protein PorQ [Bacteroidales bacterium]|nr:type IX secretion system protein PorQ [Bacteroidales bacterium]
MKRILSIIIFLLTIISLSAQTGGDNTYEFLTLPNGSRIAALGGHNVSHYDNDVNFVLRNPGLLRSEMHNRMSINYINYLSDINFGYVSYAYDLENVGTFAAGMQYINYGNFLHADETGEILGEFVPSEYSFNLAYANALSSKIQYGINLKTIYSSFFSHSSVGLALDAGIAYVDTAKLFSAGLVVKNLGIQLKPYTPGNREPLPFDIQVGITKKLRHAPFRFSLTAIDLVNWNLRYTSVFSNTYQLDDSNTENFLNKMGNIGDEFIRHFVVGVEVIPHPNFYIALGYNYRRRTELAMQTMPKLVGMSIGFGLHLSKFNISYGLASYHLAGSSNHFTLGINLDAFYKNTKL